MVTATASARGEMVHVRDDHYIGRESALRIMDTSTTTLLKIVSQGRIRTRATPSGDRKYCLLDVLRIIEQADFPSHAA